MRVDSKCDNHSGRRGVWRVHGFVHRHYFFVLLFLLLASSMNVAVEDLIGERLP